MLVCYLDDSGEQKEPVITCAGYISIVDEWIEFERVARNWFNELGLDYLHTVDLYHRRNFFKGWTSADTLKFSRRLYGILEPHVAYGIEFSVLKQRFHEQKKVLNLKKEGSSFGFCFTGVLDKLLKDEGVKAALQIPNVNISFVVENGHCNNKDVMTKFYKWKCNSGFPLGSIRFEDKKKSVALNMADFLAYFCRRIRNADKDNMREDDKKFFLSAIGGVNHRYFLATDFGDDSSNQQSERDQI